ncbi:MAG: TfoX/Sxy family protein [Chloroflexi bacterium]|jgi:DNA transformation protein and related proteins|nr:TfoX/Sxy family protein [Chloroflexota bacterium]MBT7079931.1 TfoX/Sxy family protein [Chloroflexota bacterium]MBT7290223.1 TfoX/Sxy family protein [Chloroflexota bacterium]
MSNKSEKAQFLQYVLSEVLADIDGISSRAMFGGYGIYKEGIIFAIIADEQLYFKVDQSNRSDYEQYGSHPFVYSQGKTKSTTMSYWELPADIQEDRHEIAKWVEKAYEVSKNRKKNK